MKRKWNLNKTKWTNKSESLMRWLNTKHERKWKNKVLKLHSGKYNRNTNKLKVTKLHKLLNRKKKKEITDHLFKYRKNTSRKCDTTHITSRDSL